MKITVIGWNLGATQVGPCSILVLICKFPICKILIGKFLKTSICKFLICKILCTVFGYADCEFDSCFLRYEACMIMRLCGTLSRYCQHYQAKIYVSLCNHNLLKFEITYHKFENRLLSYIEKWGKLNGRDFVVSTKAFCIKNATRGIP